MELLCCCAWRANMLASLELKIDSKSTLLVFTGFVVMIIRVTAWLATWLEHIPDLVYKWLKTDNCVTAIVADDRVKWSCRAGGHDICID